MLTNMEDMYSIESPKSDLERFITVENFQSFQKSGAKPSNAFEEEEHNTSCNFTDISERLSDRMPSPNCKN